MPQDIYQDKPILVRSYAKLNLMLRILKQREDGYHELQSIFGFIDFYDDLYFSAAVDQIENISLECISEAYISADNLFKHDLAQNLILRGASLLEQTPQFKDLYSNKSPPKFKIKLNKKIPLGAGLGGGSSNCASTLLSLNKLWGLNLSKLQLQKLGRSLGADVPIFIYGKSAWAEGIGDVFHKINLPNLRVGLITPDLHIATALIFNSNKLARDNPPLKRTDYTAGISANIYPNDCTSAIFYHFPIMQILMDKLAEFDPQITGTGACIFLKSPPPSANIISDIFTDLKIKLIDYRVVSVFDDLEFSASNQ